MTYILARKLARDVKLKMADGWGGSGLPLPLGRNGPRFAPKTGPKFFMSIELTPRSFKSAHLKLLAKEWMKLDWRRRGLYFPENCHGYEAAADEMSQIQSNLTPDHHREVGRARPLALDWGLLDL